MTRKKAEIKRFPLMPPFQGSKGSPTPASDLYICTACGHAEWYVPGYGNRPPVCHATKDCKTRMVPATPEQTEQAKQHAEKQAGYLIGENERPICPGVVCRCDDNSVKFCAMHGKKS